ncbi:TetR/AcrR family transcriptional regulator [Wenjunlia tyrosinilytica]|nr:TetR/AcrR family transcriptional regulator [Wenjunlia tyrosinilytica]
MNASRTARERARAELTREIKEEARRQLAEQGAQKLSLRAVARELGMVSSALYRYYPSRDDLLTALIIDAYDALGETAEAAAAAAEEPRARWRALCHAVRGWAVAHPHEYALIYGSPVPGYQAPRATIEPAGRVALALAGVVRDASPPDTGDELPEGLAAQAGQVAAAAGLDMPLTVLVRALVAWTQLFGMIGFELFGHLVGSADPADEFFGFTVERMADFIGLPALPASRTVR